MRDFYDEESTKFMLIERYGDSSLNILNEQNYCVHASAIAINHGFKENVESTLSKQVTYKKVGLSACRVNPFHFAASRPNETVERVKNLLSKISAQFYHPWTKEMKQTLKLEVQKFILSWESKEVPYFHDFEQFLEERISKQNNKLYGCNLNSVNTSLQLFDRHRILSCVQFITQLQSPLKTYFHGATNLPLPQSSHYLHILVPESKTAWEDILLNELISHYQEQHSTHEESNEVSVHLYINLN